MSVNTGVIYGGLGSPGRVSLSREKHRTVERVGAAFENTG